ncbi:retrovirus-related pol polyprotein from transposon TNT 1-94 [Tanacetum coccineum]
MFMDEIVESENMNVITVVTPSNVKKVESNHESVDVKNNGDVVKPKTVRKNSFRPPVIEDWDFDDDSEEEFIPNVEDKTVRPSTEKIKFVKSARETVEKIQVYNGLDPQKSLILLFYVHGNPQQKEYKEKEVIDSGCSRHMTGNKCYILNMKIMMVVLFPLEMVKGIKREFSVARTPRQNGVAKRGNRTLIEAARTMVLVIKLHTKTPYELIHGRISLIDFMKLFGCPVTILNTRDHLGKFDGKADEGFFVRYYVVSKAMRVFNKRTKIVEETLNIRFLENAPNVTGNGQDWLFDVDTLIISMNYVPVVARNQTNGIARTRDNIFIGQAEKKTEPEQEYILIPFCTTDPLISQGPRDSEEDVGMKPTEVNESGASDKEADLNNLETTMNVSPISTTIIDKDHTKEQIIRDLNSAIQTRRMTKISDEHAMMDVKSAFLYGTIEEEVYVCQPPSFEDPPFPDKVFKVYVDDIIFGSTKKSLCDDFEGLMHKRFQMSSTGELTFFLGLQVQQKEDGIFISQDKYVAKILKKFDFTTVKTTSTPMETNKALVKDEEAEAVPNSPFDLEAFSDSYYAGASLDRKSTTGGCQFLGRRLISWQCKKQTIVANSTTEVEYVAAANCCGHVLLIQNQMLDYGFNFMNTKIYIDNESTVCVVKNLVFYSKTKHIEIRHRFIRDSYEKKLIQVIKIHTDHNVVDLLTKVFDVSRFNYLIASIGLLNP